MIALPNPHCQCAKARQGPGAELCRQLPSRINSPSRQSSTELPGAEDNGEDNMI